MNNRKKIEELEAEIVRLQSADQQGETKPLLDGGAFGEVIWMPTGIQTTNIFTMLEVFWDATKEGNIEHTKLYKFQKQDHEQYIVKEGVRLAYYDHDIALYFDDEEIGKAFIKEHKLKLGTENIQRRIDHAKKTLGNWRDILKQMETIHDES